MNLIRKALLVVGCILLGCAVLLLVYALHTTAAAVFAARHSSPLVENALIAAAIFAFAAFLIALVCCLCVLPPFWQRRSRAERDFIKKSFLNIGRVLFGCAALLLAYVACVIIDVTFLIPQPSTVDGNSAVLVTVVYSFSALLIILVGCLCALPNSWHQRSQQLASRTARAP